MQRIRIYNMLLIFVLSLLIKSCTSERNICFVDYFKYKGVKNSPALSIVKEDITKKCYYQIKIINCLKGLPYEADGEMYANEKGIYVKLINPETNYFRLFNFMQ